MEVSTAEVIFKIRTASIIIRLMGNKNLRDEERATYSASVVEQVMHDCNLVYQNNGHPASFMINPVRERAESELA